MFVLTSLISVLSVPASPSLGRKSGTSCPSSKNSSPNSSPRTLGRGKGRLRLPQLGKNKLSSSKENLAASRENGAEHEQGDALTKGQALGGSQGELYPGQDSEGALANGYLWEQSSLSNGQGENHSEDDTADDQRDRDDVWVNPIYNLYAISVGAAPPWHTAWPNAFVWFLPAQGSVGKEGKSQCNKFAVKLGMSYASANLFCLCV